MMELCEAPTTQSLFGDARLLLMKSDAYNAVGCIFLWRRPRDISRSITYFEKGIAIATDPRVAGRIKCPPTLEGNLNAALAKLAAGEPLQDPGAEFFTKAQAARDSKDPESVARGACPTAKVFPRDDSPGHEASAGEKFAATLANDPALPPLTKRNQRKPILKEDFS
jgi:hypothetical protein